MRRLSIAVFTGLLCGCAMETGVDDLIGDQGDEPVSEVKQALDTNKGIILIDRTGSMTTIRPSTGFSRCRDARQQALDKVARFFASVSTGGLGGLGSSLAVWTFNGSITQLTGFVDQVAATAAINNLSPEGCSGNTRLADAVCQAADLLSAQWNSSTPRSSYLTILTDGGENGSTGVCTGNLNDLSDPTSWRFRARARLLTFPPSSVVVSTQFWTGATYINLTGVDSETGKLMAISSKGGSTSLTACSDQSVCDHQTFLAFAVDSGGVYDLVKDNNRQFPCSGSSCPAPYYQGSDW